jgi:hypothetical protein
VVTMRVLAPSVSTLDKNVPYASFMLSCF